MAKKLYEETSVQAIANAIRAKTGKTDTMTLAEMPDEIASIENTAPPITGYYEVNSIDNEDGTQTLVITDDTSISDGIIVKSRDENGLATSIDVYGSEIYYRQFYSGSQYSVGAFDGWNNVQTVNIVSATKIGDFGMGAMQQLQSVAGLENVQEIGYKAFFGSGTAGNGFSAIAPNCVTMLSGFMDSGVNYAEFPNLTQLGNGAFTNCSKLVAAKFPKATQLGTYTARLFTGCKALKTVEIGSVGYGVVGLAEAMIFNDCTQSDLTITIYTNGAKVDLILARVRNDATNATIIIKASEDTEYNSTVFAAGETILTSTVEVTDE